MLQDCGQIVFIDIPTPLARTIQTQGAGCTAPDTDSSPTRTNTRGPAPRNLNATLVIPKSSKGSTLGLLTGALGITRQLNSNKQDRTVGNTTSAVYTQLGINGGNSKEIYLHRGVDSATRDTKLHQMRVESTIIATLSGNNLIDELNTSYKRLRGWRWVFSFTICMKVRIVKVWVVM